MTVALGRKTKTIHVELSEEVKSALTGLEADISVLTSLLQEIVDTQESILNHVKGEIAMQVIDATGADGIEVFADVFAENPTSFITTADPAEPAEPPDLIDVGEAAPEQKPPDLPSVKRSMKDKPAPPESMTQQQEFDTQLDEEDRVRTTPFTRAPRQVQVDWLVEVMKDGEWYAPILIAREFAIDEKHFRYMKGALSGRLREMWEDGHVERRDSHVKGSMFEFRLKQKKE